MKKILSIIVSLVLLLSIIPINAVQACEDCVGIGETQDCTWIFKDGVLTVSGTGSLEGDIVLTRNIKEKLVEVIIEEGVTGIGYQAFKDCTKLKKITVPESVTTVDSTAFDNSAIYNNEKFWEDGLLYIGNHLVKAKKTSSGNYQIKEGTKVICYGAFDDIDEVENISIPASVELIESSIFVEGKFFPHINIANITVNPANKQYSSEDGVLFNKDKSQLLRFPSKKTGAYAIPGTVSEILYDAFLNCNLKSISIPASVEKIPDTAFAVCQNLENVILDKGVEEIGSCAFQNCTKLKNVVLPNSLKCISTGTFADCTSLESITIPTGVTNIGKLAFEGCKSLKNITIPESVTYIGENAFFDTGIYNDEKNWENHALYINNNLVAVDTAILGNYEVKSGTKIIAASAFKDCKDLTSVTIPEGITKIDDDTFSNCSKLKSITLPRSVTNIGYSAFKECNELKEVNFGGSKGNRKRLKFSEGNEKIILARWNYADASNEEDTSSENAPQKTDKLPNNLTLWVIIAVAVVLSAVIVLIVFKKRKNKQ